MIEAKYFSEGEFACPCCGKSDVSDFLVRALDDARGASGVPYIITSGVRCPDHNRDVGGSEGSSHVTGEGVDILADDSRTRMLVLEGLIRAGFTRIGIYPEHIHADTAEGKPRSVCWLDTD